MTTVTEDFTGTGALSANWSTASGTQNFDRSSDQCKKATGGTVNGRTYWNANEFTGNQECQVTVKVLPASDWGGGPLIKYNGSNNNTGYALSYNSTRLFVQRHSDDVLVIDTGATISISANDVLKLTAETSGANLLVKAYKNGVQQGSTYTDTSPQTGTRIGLASYSLTDTSWRIDDWSGGDLAGSGATEALSGSAVTGNAGTQSPGHSVPL